MLPLGLPIKYKLYSFNSLQFHFCETLNDEHNYAWLRLHFLFKEKMFPIRFRDASMTPYRYFCQEEQYFFSRIILKWLWMFIVFCSTPKQTIGSTGKHRVKIGWRSEFYCHCCYLLTHSLNSTTAVASPPIGGSSHKKRKKKQWHWKQ